ncbi:MAG: hypothetical protein AAB522_02115 [Patescibacteria group bacterium]
MDQESKQIMREQLEILKKINRHFVHQRILGIIKGVIIVGLIILGVIQLQPYLDQLQGTFSQIQGI